MEPVPLRRDPRKATGAVPIDLPVGETRGKEAVA